MADLRSREGTTMANIGQLQVLEPPPTDGTTAGAIALWARENSIAAVVWTKLSTNFEAEVKKPFSVAEALAHLSRLTPQGKARAAEYLWRAPEFVRTPVRTAMQREPWFVTHSGLPRRS